MTAHPTHIDEAPTTASGRSPSEALRALIEGLLRLPPWVLLIQGFIGLGWLRAAVEKVIDPSWWNGEVLSGFLEAHADLTLPWYQTFLETVVEPHVLIVTIVVVVAQLFAAVALLSGWKMLAGLATGAFLNLNFIAAGAVNPSIFYLICQTALLLWIIHGGGRASRRTLRLLASAASALVILNVPFISTIDPAAVVEDPAMVLVTLGLLTAVVSHIGVRYSEDPRGPEPTLAT